MIKRSHSALSAATNTMRPVVDTQKRTHIRWHTQKELITKVWMWHAGSVAPFNIHKHAWCECAASAPILIMRTLSLSNVFSTRKKTKSRSEFVCAVVPRAAYSASLRADIWYQHFYYTCSAVRYWKQRGLRARTAMCARASWERDLFSLSDQSERMHDASIWMNAGSKIFIYIKQESFSAPLQLYKWCRANLMGHATLNCGGREWKP